MGTIREPLMRSFASRSRREQRIIVTGLVLATLAALYAFLWEPGLEATRRLSTQLPRLRAQVEEMRKDQSEIAALRKLFNASRRDSTPQALVQALLAADPAAVAARAQWQSGERLSLEIAAIDFDQWLALADRLQGQAGLRIESCTVAGLPQRGAVRVEAVLAAPLAQAR